jgi:hypothetical protein
MLLINMQFAVQLFTISPFHLCVAGNVRIFLALVYFKKIENFTISPLTRRDHTIRYTTADGRGNILLRFSAVLFPFRVVRSARMHVRETFPETVYSVWFNFVSFCVLTVRLSRNQGFYVTENVNNLVY